MQVSRCGGRDRAQAPSPTPRQAMLGLALLAMLAATVLALTLSHSASARVRAADSGAPQQGPESHLAVSELEGGNEGALGTAVAMSDDGSTAIVGAPDALQSAGAAWVFTRNSASQWTEQGTKLTVDAETGPPAECNEGEEESEEAAGGCGFGHSVAISGDGNTALVGAPRGGGEAGAARIYTRSDGKWTDGELLVAAEGTTGDRFGRTVALSDDGNVAVVAGPNHAAGHGEIWIFQREGAIWTQAGEGILAPMETGEGHFGYALAISGNGDTILAGAPGDNRHTGAVWVLVRAGTRWLPEQQALHANDAQGESGFGRSLAITSDTGTAIIGGRRDAGGRGAAWAFTQSAGAWTQQGSKLTVDGVSSAIGYSVALSQDGDTAYVGAPANANAFGPSVLRFTRTGSTWKQAGVLIPGLKGGLGFGDSVATSADGRFALVGAPRNEHKLGAVLAYGPNPTIEMLEPNSGPVSGGTQVLVVGSNLEGVERIMFGSMPGTAMIAISSRELAIVSPPGTGTVDVTVTTPRGTSPVNENASFTYGKRGNSKGGGGAEEEGGAVAGVGGSPQGQGAVLGSTTTSAAACAVSLHSRGLRVTGRGSAAVQLRFTGAARCSGTLRLLVRVRNAKHRLVAKAIGTSAFALAGTRSHTFAVKLNALGRRLLRHGHGKLSARLTILRVTPSPRTAHTATVKLARPKPKPRPTTTR